MKNPFSFKLIFTFIFCTFGLIKLIIYAVQLYLPTYINFIRIYAMDIFLLFSRSKLKMKRAVRFCNGMRNESQRPASSPFNFVLIHQL